MNTLTIHVNEFIRVLDRLSDAVAYLIDIFFSLFATVANPIPATEPKKDENKSPPDLGVSTAESIGIGEALG